MPETLNLELVTPEGAVNSEPWPGVADRYSHHVSLMTQMMPGEIIVLKDEHETYLATGAGLSSHRPWCLCLNGPCSCGGPH